MTISNTIDQRLLEDFDLMMRSFLPPDPVEPLHSRIFLVRDQKVMLESDLAKLYGVTAIPLNQAVCRNIGRFPSDFMF